MRRLIVGAVLFTLFGCASTPYAPLVFSSRQSGGLDIRTATIDGRTPGVNIGFRNVDTAWIPAALYDANGKPFPVHANNDNTKDTLSVYSRFDGNFLANVAGGGATDTTIGKVFATGTAAQHLTELARSEARNACLQKVDDYITKAFPAAAIAAVKAEQQSTRNALMASCTK